MARNYPLTEVSRNYSLGEVGDPLVEVGWSTSALSFEFFKEFFPFRLSIEVDSLCDTKLEYMSK